MILIAPEELLDSHFDFSQDRNLISYLNIEVNIKNDELGIKLNRKLKMGKENTKTPQLPLLRLEQLK